MLVNILLEIAQLRETFAVPGTGVEEHLATSTRFRDCVLRLNRLAREVFLIPGVDALHVMLAARIHEVQMVLQRAIAALDNVVQRLETNESSNNGNGGR